MNHTKNKDENIIFHVTKDVLKVYLPGTIAVIGVFLNIFWLKLLANKKLNNKSYDFLRCRTVCHIFACMSIAAYVIENCQTNCQGSYTRLFINRFLIFQAFRTTLAMIILSDLILATNRTLMLYKKDTFLKNLSKKANLIFCFVLATSFNTIATYFRFDLVASGK